MAGKQHYQFVPKKKEAPIPVNKVEQVYDYFLVLDFEAVAEGDLWEIIEFPTVLFNSKTLEIEDVFHVYVKPNQIHILNDYCKQVTGIQQETVDNGILLEETLKLFDNWMNEKGLLSGTKKFIFVTCGDWDLKSMLPTQCERLGLKKPLYFNQWINIKMPFCDRYAIKKSRGMAGMLDYLKITLDGRHHSGIDDSKNISKIVKRLIMDDVQLQETANIFSNPVVKRLETERRKLTEQLNNNEFKTKQDPTIIEETKKKLDDVTQRLQKFTVY